jgi:hypothetical protein
MDPDADSPLAYPAHKMARNAPTKTAHLSLLNKCMIPPDEIVILGGPHGSHVQQKGWR